MEFRKVIINTKDRKLAQTIIGNVIGQISDGIWEDSSRAYPYAHFANSCEDGTIEIATNWGDSDAYVSCTGYLNNPYRHMDDVQILHYFARKVMQIVKMELKNMYELAIRKQMLGIWGESYILQFKTDEEYNEYQRLYKEYEIYLKEHPFIYNKKNIDRKDEMSYLDCTYGEALDFYNELMDTARNLKESCCA